MLLKQKDRYQCGVQNELEETGHYTMEFYGFVVLFLFRKQNQS